MCVAHVSSPTVSRAVNTVTAYFENSSPQSETHAFPQARAGRGARELAADEHRANPSDIGSVCGQWPSSTSHPRELPCSAPGPPPSPLASAAVADVPCRRSRPGTTIRRAHPRCVELRRGSPFSRPTTDAAVTHARWGEMRPWDRHPQGLCRAATRRCDRAPEAWSECVPPARPAGTLAATAAQAWATWWNRRRERRHRARAGL